MKKALSIGGILVIIGAIMVAVGFFSHPQPFHPFDEEIFNHVNKQTLTKQHFDRVKVTAASADVKVRQGDHYGAYYYGKKHAALQTTVKDGQLIVSQTTAVKTKHFSVSWSDDSNDQIVITVPKNKQVRDLTIKGNDDVTLKDTRFARVHVKTHGGDVTVNNSKIKGGTIDSASGDIRSANSRLTATKLNSASGDTDLYKVTVNGGQADLSSGDFTARKLTVNGHYLVNNQDGDNEAHALNDPGVILTSDDGNVSLGHQEKDDGGTLERNTDNPNLIRMITQDGDNSFD
ncbi:DUF4097 domain-containing protein [Limosilactobacillus panis]|uniref:DUF4097 family beta strand repeat-containing protein n=1 Tax=Limosilactobacillus panis TaxID=47493 RepID=UPI001C95B916|nr:DUF4097 family beta strand repeat-containing protein [Limosilactobacillus panis]QZN93059.1 DUF4097 domain-containing protein [Limosilactobacillus panis]